ncbi:DUF4915 domain-containing protein [Priestia abyssalis]|uniref:DUF4915 domain-containing protein n=1 Tax=Priestia abyssalis TaxID=1221450 RepID=UPI0009959973|nr:DUF4915 domain-containing protein [Priestia abyssalis]
MLKKIISSQAIDSILSAYGGVKDRPLNVLQYNKKLLVSSESGGQQNTIDGLYEVDIRKETAKLVRLGDFGGIKKYKDGYVVLDRSKNQLLFLDSHLNKSLEFPIDANFNNDLHGVDISNDGLIYIVSTINNTVIILNKDTMKKEGELVFSDQNIVDNHHINDICITDDSIFLSMFSFSGGWRGKNYELWDGGIIRFDRKSLEPMEIIIQNLKAPHSVLISNQDLYYCDSLNLNVSKVNLHSKVSTLVAQFYGFTRGLFLDNNILIVGQSRMRHLQRTNDKFSNISMDTGIHIYDLDLKVSKFIKLPVENVYSVVPMD